MPAFASVPNPIYIGISGGYGSTTWSQLTVNSSSPAAASSPIAANDDGFVWGFLLGYQFSKNFALEANYMNFPKSTITFAPFSFYFPTNPNSVTINSYTHAFSLFAKFIVPIHFVNHLSVFANAGAEYTHRDDILADKGRLGAIFGFGFIYALSQHISAQLAAQFYTGYGKAEILPANDYIPFLYQIQLALAYHFSL